MEIKNFDQLANKITSNILEKIDIKTECKMNDKSCLVILPNMGLGIEEYFKYIEDHYPGYEIHVGSKTKPTKLCDSNMIKFVEFDLNNHKFTHILDSVETIIVLGLKFNQLKALSKTEDNDEINQLILESLMANKHVNIMMNANELIFNKIRDLIHEIRHMGINVTNIHQIKASPINIDVPPVKVSIPEPVIQEIKCTKPASNELITEGYVLKLKDRGLKYIELDKKQLITPLAKDRLRQYKIEVRYNKEAKS